MLNPLHAPRFREIKERATRHLMRTTHHDSSRRRRYVPTWHAGDLVTLDRLSDRLYYRLGEGDALMVLQQGPTFVLVQNLRDGEVHYLNAHQARHLKAFRPNDVETKRQTMRGLGFVQIKP